MQDPLELARPGEPDMVVTVTARGDAAVKLCKALGTIDPPPPPPLGQAVKLDLAIGPISEKP